MHLLTFSLASLSTLFSLSLSFSHITVNRENKKGKCETICCNDSNIPEQIHLSLPGMGVNAMGVSWVTLDEGPQTLVNYRKTGSSEYVTNLGDTTTYKWGSWIGTIHRAMMVPPLFSFL
jgi:hypothetical protein